jgi:quercetin dioxygenase-like cupin family protein
VIDGGAVRAGDTAGNGRQKNLLSLSFGRTSLLLTLQPTPLNRKNVVMRRTALSLIACMLAAPAMADLQTSVVVTKILEADRTISGDPIVLPTGPANVVVSKYVIAPGAALPVHRHSFQRFAYILSGTLEVRNADTGATRKFNEGDFVVEGVGYWHNGSNIGAEPVVLLVIDQTNGPSSNVELGK